MIRRWFEEKRRAGINARNRNEPNRNAGEEGGQGSQPAQGLNSQAGETGAGELLLQGEGVRWRFWIVAVLFAVVLVSISLLLFRYQVVGAGERQFATAPPEPAPRGIIVDAQGTPLVVNRYFYQITATPNHFPDDETRQLVATQLNELLRLPYDEVLETLTRDADRMFTILAKAVSPDDAARLLAFRRESMQDFGYQPIHSVDAKQMSQRFYPQGHLTSHMVGVVLGDDTSLTGLEEYYEQFLRADGAGLMGDGRMEVAGLGPQITRIIPSEVDKDLVLTVDRTMQWIVREELAQGIADYGAQSGSAVVIEPSTGAVLAMVNLPDYDPNLFHRAPPEVFPNMSISAQYEPGSVFKIITFGAAVDAGKIDHATVFTDTGIHVIGGRTIFNANRIGHGHIDAADSLARSLNVVTAQIADMLGPEDFYHYVRLFGFGSATGIDLAGEIAGVVKTPNSPDWSLSDLGTNSFGQGLAATPLQMANATAAIANNGILMRPYIVEARVSGGEVRRTEPAPVRRVMSPEASDALTEMMVWVVEKGSPRAQVPGYRVAGKSGTAQIPTPQGYVERETIVTFVGFLPADDPQFAILVKLDRPDPEIGIWAGDTAAPVFSNIAKRLLDYRRIPPDVLRNGDE